MPYQSDPDNELGPEASEILKLILEETEGLRQVELGDAPPAIVFEVEE